MANNLPTNSTNLTQTSQQQMPQIPSQPAVQQPVSQMPPQQEMPVKRGHMIRTLLIMIVFALVVIIGIFIYILFANNQLNNGSPIQTQNTTSPSPSIPTQVSDEQELNSIEVGNVENDLKEIDADLQLL